MSSSDSHIPKDIGDRYVLKSRLCKRLILKKKKFIRKKHEKSYRKGVVIRKKISIIHISIGAVSSVGRAGGF